MQQRDAQRKKDLYWNELLKDSASIGGGQKIEGWEEKKSENEGECKNSERLKTLYMLMSQRSKQQATISEREDSSNSKRQTSKDI